MTANNMIGSTVHISAGIPATNDTTGFEALTFTKVGGVASISERGDGHAAITPPADLETGRVSPIKGAATAREMTITVNTEDFGDAGQGIVRTTAADNDGLASIKIVRDSGHTEYYAGFVHGYAHMEASDSSYEGCTFSMQPQYAPVIDEA